jgi:GNAT superfamily N-acetyltransferase
MKSSNMTIRPATIDDGAGIAEMRHNAIQNVHAAYYDKSILNEWSGSCEGRIQKLLSNSADVRIVAVTDSEIVGYGELVTKENLLGACYVLSSAGGKGVGRAIVEELERIARKHGITYLQLDSSLNAERFYLCCGYRITERAKHIMPGGTVMDCVKMHKDL